MNPLVAAGIAIGYIAGPRVFKALDRLPRPWVYAGQDEEGYWVGATWFGRTVQIEGRGWNHRGA